MNALHRYPGPMLAISMAFAYAGLSAALKAFLSSGRSPVLAMLFRYASSSLVVLIYAAYSKATRPNTKELKQLIVRGTIAALASASFAYSLVSLDVGVATVLNYMSPVIAGPAGMLIGEKWMRRDMLASLLALLGVALISLSDAPSSSNPAFFFGISLAIASAAFAALLGVHARYLSKLSLPGLDTTQLVLSGYLGMLVLSILLYTLEPSSDSPLDSRDYLLLSSISGLGLVGQITSTIAVSYIPAARVLVIGTLQVFLGFGVQIAMGRNPEGKELVGAGFVLVGVLLGALGKEG